MKKQPEKDLPMEIPPQWTVEPVFERLARRFKKAGIKAAVKRYELRYGSKVILKEKNPRAVNTLREIATRYNANKITPGTRPTTAEATQQTSNLFDLP